MRDSLKILLADDHSVVRQGISLVLKEALKDVSIYHAGDISKVLSIVQHEAIDILLLDINLPGGNTVNMISNIKAINQSLKILMFSAFDEEQYAVRYLHAGANGYLNKLSSEDEIVRAVLAVDEKGEYRSNKLEEVLAMSHLNPLKTLSVRETEIAELLIKGEGNLEIANLLAIQMSTVSTYKRRIFDKLDVTSIPSLIEIFKIYRDG